MINMIIMIDLCRWGKPGRFHKEIRKKAGQKCDEYLAGRATVFLRGSRACWNGRRSVRKEIFHNCQFFKNKPLIMYDLQKHLMNCSFPEAPRLWWFGSVPCDFRPGGIDWWDGELSRLKALPLRWNDVYGTWAKALELEDTVTLLLSVCDLLPVDPKDLDPRLDVVDVWERRGSPASEEALSKPKRDVELLDDMATWMIDIWDNGNLWVWDAELGKRAKEWKQTF